MVAYPDTILDSGTVAISSTPPDPGQNGNLWYNPDTGQLYVSNNGSWSSIGGGGGSSPEVFVGPAAPTGAQVLWVDTSGTTPALQLPDSGGWTNIVYGGQF